MNHHRTSQDHPARRVTGIVILLTLLLAITRLTAQDQAGKGEGAWQGDLVAFDQHLKSIVATARIPTRKEFQARTENGPKGEIQVLGAPGLLDFRPPKDTVQFRVNEALKGKAVRWEFELADDPRDDGQVWLEPEWNAKAAAKSLAKDHPALQVIMFQRNQAKLPATKLAPGQRIVVEGRIGDASMNRNFDSLHGPTAFYHPQDIPIFFWVGLDKIIITRIDPTEEQLRTHVLSGNASLERKAWKVLEVNGKAEFDEKLAGHVFDGDAVTVWDTGGKDGQPKHPHSLLVDMGHAETVAGVRYLPPRQRDGNASPPAPSVDGTPKPEPRDGVIGKFSFYVSNSIKEMGEPVGSGTFTRFRVEQEAGFPETEGRYVKLVVHSAANESPRTTVAELNLLAPAVPFTDYQREPVLPPMADAIERFELLHKKLRTPPRGLALTRVQRSKWWQAHGEAGSRWDVSYDLIHEITGGKQATYEGLERATAKNKLSPVRDANLYAVAARPEFSTEEQRAEMALTAKGMKQARLVFLAAIKRILSPAQQETLKEFLADQANLLPGPDDENRPRRRGPAPRPTPLPADAPPVTAVLVRADSEWRWLHPVDGVDPAKADPDFHRTFFAPDFDDASWQTGQDRDGTTGGFGYGDESFKGVDLGTPTVAANNDGKRQGYSAYFRHRFTTVTKHTHLELRCQRDDGIIVYLDGKEMARDNMSDGEEAYRLPAVSAVGNQSETTVYRIPLPGALPAGDHVLAISLHNPENASSDLRIGGITLVESVPPSAKVDERLRAPAKKD